MSRSLSRTPRRKAASRGATAGPRVLLTTNALSPARDFPDQTGNRPRALLPGIWLLWWDDRLPDQRDGEVSFIDVVCFTTITVTTVGHGDIVPVSIRARLLDALVVTPGVLNEKYVPLATDSDSR